MSVAPVGTVYYRLLVQPELGEGLGNTVYVGLDVQGTNERNWLLFSGLAQRVNTIRDALDDARVDGHLFETTGRSTARELNSAMRYMKAYAAKVVRGEALLAEIKNEISDDVGRTPATVRRSPVTTPMHARFSYGNPYAPMGFGAYSVEVFPDNTIEVIHDRQGTKRIWRARAEPALWKHLAAALESSGFPRNSSPTHAPPGTASFSFAVFDESGATTEVRGFPSIGYRDISLLFSQIVGQMSNDQVFGFVSPVETLCVTEVSETT